ncbi:Cof-type HAD-IIB family hydrolase [Lachnospiraceae bacterium OttesenSCG-928-D06]|nr:Cof-type HAD-IIB family hydrolase [Lachnospiraceae bacterium OttesenSCG-928-D06]
MIKLIASDLDGTLLLNGSSKCNPKVYALIEKLTEEGVYFLAASGRQYQSLQKLFYPVRDKIMYLCENGAMVIHNNEVLQKHAMEPELAMKICHEVMGETECEILISGEKNSYLLSTNQKYVDYICNVMGNAVKFVKSPEEIQEPIVKIAACAPEDKMEAVKKRLEKKLKKHCQLVTSGNKWLDFLENGISKGAALKTLGKKLGILPEEMMAFGDNENDRTMLSFVGHPYLMRSCNPTMKDMGEKVLFCDTVEEELEKFLKNK